MPVGGLIDTEFHVYMYTTNQLLTDQLRTQGIQITNSLIACLLTHAESYFDNLHGGVCHAGRCHGTAGHALLKGGRKEVRERQSIKLRKEKGRTVWNYNPHD